MRTRKNKKEGDLRPEYDFDYSKAVFGKNHTSPFEFRMAGTITMPPARVKTIEEDIQYEYSIILSRSVFGDKINYGFVSDRYKVIRKGVPRIL